MKTIFPVCENAAETQKLDMGRDFEICENNFYNTVRTAGYIKEFQNSWGQNNMQVHWI